MIDWWAGAGGTGSAFSHRWGRVMAHALQVELWHLNVSLRLLAFSHGLNLDAIVMSIFPATLVLTRLKLPPSMPPCKVCFMTSSIRSCPIPFPQYVFSMKMVVFTIHYDNDIQLWHCHDNDIPQPQPIHLPRHIFGHVSSQPLAALRAIGVAWPSRSTRARPHATAAGSMSLDGWTGTSIMLGVPRPWNGSEIQNWMVWKILERDVKGIAMVDDAWGFLLFETSWDFHESWNLKPSET